MMLPAQAAMLSGGLKNALIANPDATAAALQQAIRGGSQEALQALVLEHAAIPDDVDAVGSFLSSPASHRAARQARATDRMATLCNRYSLTFSATTAR